MVGSAQKASSELMSGPRQWSGRRSRAVKPQKGQIIKTVVGKQSRQQAKVSAQERPAATKKAHKMVQELQSVKGQNSVG